MAHRIVTAAVLHVSFQYKKVWQNYCNNKAVQFILPYSEHDVRFFLNFSMCSVGLAYTVKQLNRTIHRWIVDDLANFSGGELPGSTPPSVRPKCNMLLRFEIRRRGGGQRRVMSKIEDKFHSFWSSVKISEETRRMLSGRIELTLRSKLWW